MSLLARQLDKVGFCPKQIIKQRKSWPHEKKSITCIESLSNELFYEIFDYLDGYDLCRAFLNLNQRFQNLFSSSTLRLQINLLPYSDAIMQQDCISMISRQRHQLASLRLMYTSNIDQFFALMPFNSTFPQLESLTLIRIKSDNFFQRCSMLMSLPRLRSFYLSVEFNSTEFSNMYKLILRFPVLKHITISSDLYQPTIPLPIASKTQFSAVEYLNIDHACRFEDFISILSYTPQLNRLTCKELIKSNDNQRIEVPFRLDNLTRIRIDECYTMFDQLEIFIKKISSLIEVLHLTTYWDSNYLDADRWEQLILEHMPYLRKFYLQHHDFIDDDFEITDYHKGIDQFTTSFWFTRSLMFEFAIDINDGSWSEIIYSIHPHKRKWYELHDIDLYSNQETNLHLTKHDDLQDIELAITTPIYLPYQELFTDSTIILFTLLRITRLNISSSPIYIDILMDLIHCLPNLVSLKVWSISLTKSPWILFNKNKITKVNIQHLTELKQIQFFIDICPSIQYLEINCSKEINFQSLIRFILGKDIKYIPSLCLLCLSGEQVDEKIVEDLQEIIQVENLRSNYAIKHTHDKIYLQWK